MTENKIGRNFIIVTLLLITGILFPVSAYELDYSVDKEIKQKYDISKPEYELPKLPTASVPQKAAESSDCTGTLPEVMKISDGKKIPSGTKFTVKSDKQVSDNMVKGQVITFTTTVPVYKKEVTLPEGTKITGTVIKSAAPGIAGNGGLVKIIPTAVSYNGNRYEINGKITKANDKKVFYDNIKGKRGYLNGVADKVNDGTVFNNKARKVATKVSEVPVVGIVSVVPRIIGFAGSAACTVVSPIAAIGSRGSNVRIPSGSVYEIKLTEDAFVK